MKNIGKFKLLSIIVLCITQFYFSAAGTVDFKQYDIDSNINDIIWCGTNKEVILALSELSTLYRSDDHGFSWKKLNDIFKKTGVKELEDHENEVFL